MMVAEGLVQSRRWEKTFGGFSRKGIDGLFINIWWNFINGHLED
jgi:hypothetical protein